MSYTAILNDVPQSEPLEPAQFENNAGGFVWKIDKWELLHRFLILGSEGGSYYAKPRKLTQENAQNVIACIKEDSQRVVFTIAEVSHNGRAPKNDAAIFALALVMTHGNAEGKSIAYNQLGTIVRTGTHLFQFVEEVNALRGWSRGLRRAVANWYLSKEPDHLAYQLLKYKQRNGWNHRDVLRLAHPNPGTNGALKACFKAVTKGVEHDDKSLPKLFKDVQLAANVINPENVIRRAKLTREMVPTEQLNRVEVWDALLDNMPLHAIVRNLGKMTNVGLLRTNMDDAVNRICSRLKNQKLIIESRLHPLAILNASLVYSNGKGDKGKLTWEPVSNIIAALDTAFYLAFKNVQPTNKRIMLALDVSASMDGTNLAGTAMNARTASSALTLLTNAVEPYVETVAFADNLTRLTVPKNTTLVEFIGTTRRIPFGGTDCALPMLHAAKNRVPVDCFVVYTDSETWSGKVHPKVALDFYRKHMGIEAKLVVVGMCANEFSIADPNDRGMMDVVGFDTSVPQVIAEFMK